MIVVDRAGLRELLAGNMLTIPDLDLRYEKHRIYDVGTNDRAMMCRAYVVGIDRQSVQLRVVYQQRTTLLRRGNGYTDEPSLAVFGEPEGSGPVELEAMGRDARERWAHARRVERDGESLSVRVAEVERRAAGGDEQAKRCLFVVRQRLEKVEERLSRDMERARNPKRDEKAA